MKQIIAILLLCAFGYSAQAQIFNKPLREAKKARAALIAEGWDITLPPEEVVPEHLVQKSLTVQSITNWGTNTLLPPDVKARIVAECKNKVIIKVYDTSGGSNHGDLSRGQLPGSNYSTAPGLPDVQGHGTHVAGIIAGKDFGLVWPLVDAGLITWKPVKILADAGQGSFDWFANAVKAEDTDNAAQIAKGTFVVCNGSFGGGTAKVAAVESALQASTAKGVVYCIAAGNTQSAGVNYPGNSSYTIACGSLDENLTRSSYSTFGPEVNNAMPGRNINSTYVGNTYAVLSGTSMATPFLTAAAAIAYSKWGAKIKGAAGMKLYLAWCGTDLGAVGKDDQYGWGIDYIKSILDKDPVNIPPGFGGPVTPPPPPPPPVTPPVGRELRTLSYSLAGNWPVTWSLLSTASGSGPTVFRYKTKDVLSKATVFNTVTITKVELAVRTTSDAVTTATATKANVDAFFKGVGLLLAANNDYADAVYWTGYFLDMQLDKTNKQTVEILRIEGKDEKGSPVMYDKSQVKAWPPQ